MHNGESRTTLFPAERLLLAICAGIACVDVVLVAASSADLRWLQISLMALTIVLPLGIGQVYRRLGRSDRIGLATTGAGLFGLMFASIGTLNYMIVPMLGERIDPWLFALDERLGYNWLAFVTWMSFHPKLTNVLGIIYMSSLAQMAAMIVLLGFMHRVTDMHRFLLTGMWASIGTIAVWSIAPSSGPSAYVQIPPEVLDRVKLVVESSYGDMLNRFMTSGPSQIPPIEQLGLIGFPSFHTVMAMLALWFVPRTLVVFLPMLLLNIAMVPAILLHGGHHLVDVLGGVVTFFVALAATRSTMRRLSR